MHRGPLRLTMEWLRSMLGLVTIFCGTDRALDQSECTVLGAVKGNILDFQVNGLVQYMLLLWV